MTSIDDKFAEIERYKGVVNKAELLTFSFHYAIEICRLNGFQPKDSYLTNIVESRIDRMLGYLKSTYEKGREHIVYFRTPPVKAAEYWATQDRHKFLWGTPKEQNMR